MRYVKCKNVGANFCRQTGRGSESSDNSEGEDCVSDDSRDKPTSQPRRKRIHSKNDKNFPPGNTKYEILERVFFINLLKAI